MRPWLALALLAVPLVVGLATMARSRPLLAGGRQTTWLAAGFGAAAAITATLVGGAFELFTGIELGNVSAPLGQALLVSVVAGTLATIGNVAAILPLIRGERPLASPDRPGHVLLVALVAGYYFALTQSYLALALTTLFADLVITPAQILRGLVYALPMQLAAATLWASALQSGQGRAASLLGSAALYSAFYLWHGLPTETTASMGWARDLAPLLVIGIGSRFWQEIRQAGRLLFGRCPDCGDPAAPDAATCHVCGASIGLRCRNCGNEPAPGASYCDRCGFRLFFAVGVVA